MSRKKMDNEIFEAENRIAVFMGGVFYKDEFLGDRYRFSGDDKDEDYIAYPF